MQNVKHIKNVLYKLNYILDTSQKRQAIAVFLMSIVAALFELLGVSIVLPLVQAVIKTEESEGNLVIRMLKSWFHPDDHSKLIIYTCVFIIVVYTVKNLYLLFFSWVRTSYAGKIKRDIMTVLFQTHTSHPYAYYLKTNTGDLMSWTLSDPAGVYAIINQGLRILTELLTVFCIVGFLCFTDWKLSMGVIFAGMICLILVMGVFRSRIRRQGIVMRKSNATVSKYARESYEGIKEIKVMNRVSFFEDRFKKAISEQQRASVAQAFSTEAPIYIVELVCVSFVMLAIGLRMRTMDNTVSFIPQLAVFVMSTFRIMPSIGRVTASFNTFMFYVPSLNALYDDVREIKREQKESSHHESDEDYDKLAVKEDDKHSLTIDHITWRYESEREPVLNDITLNIREGTSIGIIGASGAGKSTLMNIILGLFTPQKGRILFEGCDICNNPERWASSVGYVPQDIYLTDDTIRNNIAFGMMREDISDERIWTVLEEAQLADHVSGLPDGLDTFVGDRGIRLSGGQRQRIGIARALYHNPKIVLFDEATSALDNETEEAVMEAIEALHGVKTMIIVAHRLTTIQHCDEVYEIMDGRLIRR